MPPAATNAPPSPSSTNASAPAPDRQELLGQALEQVLLAREQARLGLMDEAEASWNRAITILTPLAARDGEIAEQMRQVEAERDQALRDAELRAQIDEDEDTTEAASTEILDSPEPEIDPTQLAEVGRAAQEATADYPIVLNDRVYAWIEAWQEKLHGFFEGSLERSGMYVDRFREIFAEEGLPQDLVYLAHVESGFKTGAYSRAAARGIFQFIAETGRRYGLVANWWVDERADPEKSCRASAAYLRDLYAEFGDWYMALAAYNAGEGKVRDVIARTGSKDFFNAANLRLFHRDTRNYVPAIIAATIIAKNPAKFGFPDVAPLSPAPYDIVTVPGPTSLQVLADILNTDIDTLHQLNPSLRRHSTPPAYKDFAIRVPVGSAEGFAERLAQVPPDKRLVQPEHVVRRGQTLTSIARLYGVSTRAIAEANQLGRRPRLHAGMVLIIPESPDSAPDRLLAGGRRTSRGGYYTVRRGDTLSVIARKHRVSVKQLQAWNGLGSSTQVHAGQKVRVSRPTSTAVASAKVKKGEGEAVKSVSAKPGTKSAPVASAKTRSHVVRRGETLWKIARQYGVDASEIIALNRLGRKAKLQVGQRLLIPSRVAEMRPRAAAVHVVKRGETLAEIARVTGVSLDELRQANNLNPDAAVYPGDQISLPR